jgi:hypothetical protein
MVVGDLCGDLLAQHGTHVDPGAPSGVVPAAHSFNWAGARLATPEV